MSDEELLMFMEEAAAPVIGLRDYTKAAETDPFGQLTVTPTKIAAFRMTRAESTWVSFDDGAAQYSGDFTHNFEFTHTALNSDLGGFCYPWGLTNNDVVMSDIIGLGEDALSINMFHNGTAATLTVREVNAGVSNNSSLATLFASGVKYYCTVRRDEAIGTFGTLYLDVYSNSARTTLIETGSVLLTEKQDFRYLYGISSLDTASGQRITVDMENLEIVV